MAANVVSGATVKINLKKNKLKLLLLPLVFSDICTVDTVDRLIGIMAGF